MPHIENFEYKHTPVMLNEVLEYLNPKPGDLFIDCTLGGGGYTEAIAQKIQPDGLIIANDLDEMAIQNAKTKPNKYKNIILSHDNFKNLATIVDQNKDVILARTRVPAAPADQIQPDEKTQAERFTFSGVVFDLGLSSAQLEDRSRGFSFQMGDSPIDMAFGAAPAVAGTRGTAEILNQWSERELTQILKNYGEEKFAYRIAQAIIERRKNKKFETVDDLLEAIKAGVPVNYLRGNIHYATRTFQALRMATNDELASLEEALPQAVELLRPGGRIVIVSFHSLEDRIVKNYFRQESRDCICPPEAPICGCGHSAKLKIITKKPVRPSKEELSANPRSRSAKLRVAERLNN